MVTAEAHRLQLYIGGAHRAAAGDVTLETVDPTRGEPWATIADASPEDVDAAVQSAKAAFRNPEWRGLSPTRRGRLLMRLADLVIEHAEEIATLEVRENGKLYREMLTQLKIVPDWLNYFGGLADKIEGTVHAFRSTERAFLTTP